MINFTLFALVTTNSRQRNTDFPYTLAYILRTRKRPIVTGENFLKNVISFLRSLVEKYSNTYSYFAKGQWIVATRFTAGFSRVTNQIGTTYKMSVSYRFQEPVFFLLPSISPFVIEILLYRKHTSFLYNSSFGIIMFQTFQSWNIYIKFVLDIFLASLAACKILHKTLIKISDTFVCKIYFIFHRNYFSLGLKSNWFENARVEIRLRKKKQATTIH